MRDIQLSQEFRDLKKLSIKHRYWLWEVGVCLTKVKGGYRINFIPPGGGPTVTGPVLRKDLSKLNVQTELSRFLTQWFEGSDQMREKFVAAMQKDFTSNAPVGRAITFRTNGTVTVR